MYGESVILALSRSLARLERQSLGNTYCSHSGRAGSIEKVRTRKAAESTARLRFVVRKKDAACFREMLSSSGWRHVPVGGVGAVGKTPVSGVRVATVLATAGVVRAVEDILSGIDVESVVMLWVSVIRRRGSWRMLLLLSHVDVHCLLFPLFGVEQE